MLDLRWSWLCIPYVVCTLALAAIGLVAALIRGDRVLRLGVIGAAPTALPWSICSGLACCTDDAAVATRVLRLGLGPVALVGPNLLLVLLGISGQLERHRWVARLAGVVGAVMLALCWGTAWVVPGVRRLSSGVFYVAAGPLTDLQISQMAIWLAVGLVIARRSMMRGERQRMMRVLFAAFVLAAIGGTDLLLVHDVVGVYPIAWLPTTIACGITVYLELRSDLLRPRGFDRRAAIELGGFAAAALLIAGLAALREDAAPVAVALLASALWVTVIAALWSFERRRPPRRRFGERALAQLVAQLSDLEDDQPIARALAALWRQLSILARATWRAEADGFTELATGEAWRIDREVVAWLVEHGEPLAAADLATMRLGAIRPQVEAFVASHGATLIVPLIDRGVLVGLVEARHVAALREAERGLVAESARAAARALTCVQLARRAAREGATAREVEVAEAMRRQGAQGTGDAELGAWSVAAAYRSAARTTGAAWSASLVGGRLAVLVTEGQAHGVVAALATAALTGAFTAATTLLATEHDARSPGALVDELLATLQISAARVRGAPIAALVAVLDAEAQTITWACAGHPGAVILDRPADALAGADVPAIHEERRAPVALGGGGARLGGARGDPPAAIARGEASLAADSVVVVASTGVRGGDAAHWHRRIRERAATGAWLPALVDATLGEPPSDDLLVVVVRQRAGSVR